MRSEEYVAIVQAVKGSAIEIERDGKQTIVNTQSRNFVSAEVYR